MAEYKNSHTTSTKCQYHAAHSNPMRCSLVLFSFLNRFSEMAKKMDPRITCNPWNPVAIKNLEPKVVSEILKGASQYSNPCKIEKATPKMIVIVKACVLGLNCFFNISWCAQVTVTPEDRSSTVLSNGILIGLNGWILLGGHTCPSSTVGEILL